MKRLISQPAKMRCMKVGSTDLETGQDLTGGGKGDPYTAHSLGYIIAPRKARAEAAHGKPAQALNTDRTRAWGTGDATVDIEKADGRETKVCFA